jgi:nitroimidazol reductase NimA-like FMN-containing flavoprotein (pyridoxamine 5'-phosphate oxidase superfamily)
MTVSLDPKSRDFVVKILDDARDITIATKRADGFPQATVVSFVHDGPTIYFSCGAGSQKAENIAHDNRVSVTATPSYKDWKHIRGVSMGARAHPVTDEQEQARVGQLMMKRFPEAAEFEAEFKDFDMAVFRVEPEVISILDYEKGFGHTELKTGLSA